MTTATNSAERFSAEDAAASEKMSGIYLRVALGAMLVNIAMAVSFTALSFFTPVILKDFEGFESSSFLIYYTLLGAFSAFAMPLAGQLIDKVKAQGLLVIGGTIATVGLVFFSFSSALWMFYAAGIVIGIGIGLSALYVPVVVVNRWFFKNKATIMGVVLAGSGVGGVILGVVMPMLLSGIGWRSSALFLAAFFAAFTILPGIFLVRNSPVDHGIPGYGELSSSADQAAAASGAEPGLTQKEAFTTPGFVVLVFSYLLFGMTYAMTQHFVAYLSDTPWGIDVSPGKISTVVITCTLSLIVFKPMIGYLIDKLGLMKALWITLMAAGIAVFISTWVTYFIPYLVLVVFMALGASNGTVSPPLIAQACYGLKDYSKIWGVLGMAYPIGLAVGTPLWGWFPQKFGSYGMGFVLVPFVTVIFLLGFQFAINNTRPRWASSVDV
ncbi:MFS transporter [Corynebacterium aquatimens]|uniref:MFS family permease n=1 Tax=Corynebacterium aquatimens TaxID=1190508 RepID=A0A931E2U2_9CORY|nr:MFS transporter [Corynebacterium aquatimens]MBG6121473.1 MFS family permease [Corynebacterium aquatimens]WJY65983.1 Major Facilitator Superfamily protein [Corynebacterium aquatimens]